MEIFAIPIAVTTCMIFGLINGADVGDTCQVARSGAQGVCQVINSCQAVVDEIVHHGLFPAQCGFRGRDQIVCCPVPVTTTTTTTLRPTRISQRSELPTHLVFHFSFFWFYIWFCFLILAHADCRM